MNFTITLHKVEAPKLPEVDAKFAESVGIAGGDVSKLEDEIRINLQREVARRLRARSKEAAMGALLKAARFDGPKTLLEWELQNLLRQTVRASEESVIRMKDLPLSPEMFAERAEKRVKLGLILSDLAQKHGLKVKPEQVRALVDDNAQSYDQPEEVVRWYYADSSRLQEIENLVMEENVTTWVMGQAKTADKSISFAELMGN